MKTGTERDEAVRVIVQRSITEMEQTNDAFKDRRFMENRQHYGSLTAFAAALQELGANISFEAVFVGDLVRIDGYTMQNIAF